jgi:hypothetical protein
MNAFGNETNPGIYAFRVRLKYEDSQSDITRAVRVEPTPYSEGFTVTDEENFSVRIVPEEGEDDGGIPVTGMAPSVDVGGSPGIFDAFLSWLRSIFKF